MHFRAALLLALTALVAPLSGAEWVTAHYPSYQRALLAPVQIDCTRFTQLIYFQITPRANGTLNTTDVDYVPPARIANPDGQPDALYLRDQVHAAGGKILVCVGGDGTYAAFAAAIGEGPRARFVDNLVKWVKDHGYDGLDVDLEPIRPKDAVNFFRFAKLLREKLTGEISAATLLTGDFLADQASAKAYSQRVADGTTNSDETPHLARATDFFDEVNLMAYDLSGPYEGWNTWHDSPVMTPADRTNADHTPYPSADQSVHFYTDDEIVDGVAFPRVPAAKIGVGASSNGKQWWPAQALGQKASGMGLREMTYRDIINRYFTFGGYRYDADAKAAYLLVRNSFISFPDAKASADKARYVHSHGLGGLMVWDISSQYLNGQFPLLTAMKDALAGSATQPGITLSLAPEGSLTSGQSTVDLGSLPLGGTRSLTFSVHNGGTTELTHLAASFTAGNAGELALLGSPLPSTLPAGQDAAVTVRFTASVRGLTTTLLHLTSSDPATPSFDVALQARALAIPDVTGLFIGYSASEKALLNLNLVSSPRTAAGFAGTFTGTFVQNGISTPIRGTLSPQGELTQTFGTPGLAASLRLQAVESALHPGGFSLAGTLGSDASFMAWHTAYTPGVPLSSAGTYTFTFAPAPGAGAAVPQGSGYASVTITPAGVARISGALPDGTPLLSGTSVVGGGTNGSPQLILNLVPHLNSYALIGAIDLGKTQGALSSGVLAWQKAPAPGAVYPDGFTTELTANGHRWVPPNAGQPALALPGNGAKLALQGGGLGAEVEEVVSLPATTRFPLTSFILATPNTPDRLTASLNVLTGLISGTFYDASSQTTLRFGAAALQSDPATGEGVFLGPVSASRRTSGVVSLTARP